MVLSIGRIMRVWGLIFETPVSFVRGNSCHPYHYSKKVVHFRKDFTTDYADYTDKEIAGRDGSPSRPARGRLGEASLPTSVKSV